MQRNSFDELKLIWVIIPKGKPATGFGAGFTISAMVPMFP
jgi:hypothetical protein